MTHGHAAGFGDEEYELCEKAYPPLTCVNAQTLVSTGSTTLSGELSNRVDDHTRGWSGANWKGPGKHGSAQFPMLPLHILSGIGNNAKSPFEDAQNESGT